MFRSLHHIGIVTDELEREIDRYRDLFGAVFTVREILPEQGVEVALARLPDGGAIELLCPITDESGVASFLRERGVGLHHSAFAVENLGRALQECRDLGLDLIDEEPRLGVGGHQIAFLHPRSTGRVLVELVEVKGPEPQSSGAG